MKKFLLIFLVLAILGLSGYFGWRYFNQKSAVATPEVTTPATPADNFIWGVTTRPNALAKYYPTRWQEQIKLAKDLGIGYVRIDWEPDAWIDGKQDPVGFNDILTAEITKQGMRPYLNFGQNGKITASATAYQDGYDLATRITTANKGKIDYYQLGNEISSESLKGGQYPGDKTDQYDLAKYAKIRDWLKGAEAGIKAADPKAKTVVVGQWTQTAFFDMLQKDGVNFDIIGWDWFSDMNLMKDVKLSDKTLLTEKLQSYNKPVMLVEVGQRPDGNKDKGFTMNEDKQVQFISDMANWAHGSGFITGFFAFELTDVTNFAPGGYVDRYGLVDYERNDGGVGVMDHLRKAYSTYAAIVKKYSK